MASDDSPALRLVADSAHIEPARPPAMTDVAARAGVSHQTVSRVLNDHPNVAAATKSRVLEAIAELGYRRNLSARVLATGRSQVIGVVTQNTTLYGPSSMLESLSVAAMSVDMSLTVGHLAGFDPVSMRRVVERLVEQGAAGIIFIVPVDAAVSALDVVPAAIPIVTVDGLSDWRSADVSVDQHTGGLLATRHLLEHGHPTVWHVAGPEQWNDGRAREAGWKQALQEAGAEQPPILRGDWSAASGYEAGKVLARIPDCTAIFAANDHMALGIMRALAERGRAIPDDVSLVGFDDVPESGFLHPPLTTVRQEFADVGRASLTLMLDQLRTGTRTESSVLVPPVLVTRGTVGPVPQRGS